MKRLGFREIGVCVAIAYALCGATTVAQVVGPTLYDLDVQFTPAGGGAVSTTPDASSFQLGEFVTVTAQPADGYEFLGWEGDIAAAESSLTFEMTADTTLTAVFALAGSTAPHSLTALVEPTGTGAIVRDPAEFEYDDGVPVTLTAHPDEGYVFSGWTGDVPAGVNPYSPTITVTMNSDMMLLATFAAGLSLEGPPYVLIVESVPAAGGTVAAYPNEFEFDEGATVTVTATPAAGYEFRGWEGDLVGTDSTISFDIVDDTNLRAVFAERDSTGPFYVLTAFVGPSGAGTIVREPSAVDYAAGTQVTLTAYSLEGFVFTGWEGDLPDGADANAPTLVVTMSDHLDIKANFAAAQVLTDGLNGGSGACGAMGLLGLGMLFSLMLMLKLDRAARW
jgi:hypothetical protein